MIRSYYYHITSLFLLLFFIGISCKQTQRNSDNNEQTFNNPVLPGFYPDPSICRVGDDYYLVNSSFEWFPGIPVFHSKDLVNWEQIGYVLKRKTQLALNNGLESSRGIYAPTIRFHNGLFYVITTCIDCGGNFFVTAENPAGPWSDPVWLNEAPGFDPSLFWDDDGTCWYTGAGNLKKEKDYKGQNGVFIQELDLNTNKLKGEPVQISFGHAVNAEWQEGPHLYKIGGSYLLITAEGGTSFNHSVTVFRSDSITGRYIPSQINPVLTHRHLGKAYPIHSVGHSDLVQTQNGEWWGVVLGVRQYNGINYLGRETFLVPVKFEDGWPVYNPGIGKVRLQEVKPLLNEFQISKIPDRDNFNDKNLSFEWNMLHTPQCKWYTINNGYISLKVRKEKTTELKNPSMLVRRIRHFNFLAKTGIEFKQLPDSAETGLIVIHNEKQQFRLAVTKENGQTFVCFFEVDKGVERLVKKEELPRDEVILGLRASALNYQFYFQKISGGKENIFTTENAEIVSSSHAGSFTGPFIGIYATGNGKESKSVINFDWFDYQPLD